MSSVLDFSYFLFYESNSFKRKNRNTFRAFFKHVQCSSHAAETKLLTELWKCFHDSFNSKMWQLCWSLQDKLVLLCTFIGLSSFSHEIQFQMKVCSVFFFCSVTWNCALFYMFILDTFLSDHRVYSLCSYLTFIALLNILLRYGDLLFFFGFLLLVKENKI